VTDAIEYNGILSLRNTGGLLQKVYGEHTNRKKMTGITEQNVFIDVEKVSISSASKLKFTNLCDKEIVK
jgi:hypothetical protein